MEGNSFTDELLEHINHIRMNPKSYAHKLRNYSQYFEDNVLRLPELKNGLLTNEGAVAFEEAATFMESLPKMEMISLDNNLSLAAQAMANEMSYYTDLNQMGNIDRKGIIEQFALTSISIGVVIVEKGRFSNILEIGEVGAQVKHLSKTTMGSSYAIDRREEND